MPDFTKRFGRDRDDGDTDRGGVATRETTRDDVTTRDRDDTRGDVAHTRRETAAPAGREVRARQRDEFGGFNWGAAFFGWLVAIGIGVLLTAILSAAGAAIGLTEGTRATPARTPRRSASSAASC